MSAASYVFFIAHAGRDVAYARRLYDRLQSVGRNFLDAVDLAPGAQWDTEIPERQRQSAATLALVSAATDAAYYLREEIASAIAYQRQDPTTHRLVPIFLDGRPSDPTRVPYGIRALDSLDAAALGLDGLVVELGRLAEVLGDREPPPPLPPPPPVDRLPVYDALSLLLPPQFDEVVFRVAAPPQHLAPATAAQSRRALDLVQWSEQDPAGLQHLAAAVRRVAPGVLRPG